jgi:hypothetical protein
MVDGGIAAHGAGQRARPGVATQELRESGRLTVVDRPIVWLLALGVVVTFGVIVPLGSVVGLELLWPFGAIR